MTEGGGSQELASRKLTYTIQACSSFSSMYVPQNILENKPGDESSRWSSDTNNPPQYITLKLEKPAIVTGINFGKFKKTHVCNLKKFKVFGGIDENSYIELLESGLKNDNSEESFVVKNLINNHHFACSYIKIQPIQSWGPSFNFSVWFVELTGDNNPKLVSECTAWHREYRERETIRLCLKHFREHNYLEAFESLEKKTRVQLEDPLLTKLHTTLVKEGDYEGTEQLINQCLEDGIFQEFFARQHPKPVWSPLIYPQDTPSEVPIPLAAPSTPDSDTQSSSEEKITPVIAPSEPPPRGGHQLVMDGAGQTVYLFGGWDGNQDLADFWSYHIPSNKWTLMFANTEAEGGPPPRSCHKMVLDPTYRHIFVLGRYIERNLRDSVSAIKSDFYLLDLASGKWTLISDDTAADGGPNLIFDHQMSLDVEKRNIYVFGGQSLHFSLLGDQRPEKRFSGLYCYHIPTSSWKCLWEEGEPNSLGLPLKSRTGHSMLFNSADRNLYIFGGQRKHDEYVNDFFTYNVDTETVTVISDGVISSDSTIPAVGYTQRATIDSRRGEIHVITGLNKDKDKRPTGSGVSNSFWIYEIQRSKWSCIYRNEKNNIEYWSKRQSVEPRPRYAHQLVYDEESECHYLFGGNPGGKEGNEGKLRLGDFWRLSLVRPARQDLQRFCRLSIRSARFKELCKSPLEALNFLQSNLAKCVDHENSEEQKYFQNLPSKVFMQVEDSNVHKIRVELFNVLVDIFPNSMTQPSGNLLDLVPLEAPIKENTTLL